MLRLKKVTISTCFVIGICLISFEAWPALGARPAFEAWPARNPIAIHLKDPESLISKKLKAQRLIRKGPPSQFRNITVETGINARTNLGNIAKIAFAKHNLFQKRLLKIKPSTGILFKRPIIKSETYEFEDSFVLVKSTSITVVKPNELTKVSPQFKSFLGKKRPGKVNLSKLSSESRKGLDDFIRIELPKRPNNDPLKIAAKKGKKALLEAIAEGKGLFETVEEVVIPKKLPPLINGVPQLPVLKKGVFNYKHYKPANSDFLKAIRPIKVLPDNLADRVSGIITNLPTQQEPATPSRRMVKVVGRMKRLFDAQFMTGYTLGANWEWGKTWKYPSGFFRVRMGAGYALGLRFPIKVHGEINPTRVTVTGPNDVRTSFETSITAEPINGDCVFYRNTGLSEPESICGKELALHFGIGYGYKFRAVWTTVKERKYRMQYGINWSKDFTPPFANSNRRGLVFWIPPRLTGTQFDLAVISGYLKAGFKLSGTGTVHFDHVSFHGNTKEHKALTFINANPVRTKTTLMPLVLRGGEKYTTEKYGFKLYNPAYTLRPTITPGVMVTVNLGYRWFSRRISTGAMWISALEMLIPPVSFTRHDGTNRDYSWNDGVKTFRKR